MKFSSRPQVVERPATRPMNNDAKVLLDHLAIRDTIHSDSLNDYLKGLEGICQSFNDESRARTANDSRLGLEHRRDIDSIIDKFQEGLKARDSELLGFVVQNISVINDNSVAICNLTSMMRKIAESNQENSQVIADKIEVFSNIHQKSIELLTKVSYGFLIIGAGIMLALAIG